MGLGSSEGDTGLEEANDWPRLGESPQSLRHHLQVYQFDGFRTMQQYVSSPKIVQRTAGSENNQEAGDWS